MAQKRVTKGAPAYVRNACQLMTLMAIVGFIFFIITVMKHLRSVPIPDHYKAEYLFF